MAKGEIFKGLPQWAQGVIAVSAVAGVAYLIYTLTKKEKDSVKDVKEELKNLDTTIVAIQNTGKKPTLTAYEMSTLANKIWGAVAGVGTDESAIYRAFASVKNDLDVLGVVKAFGMRKEFGMVPERTLGQWLTDELDAKEMKALNDILARKGIKYRF
jgi:hypothetical protein